MILTPPRWALACSVFALLAVPAMAQDAGVQQQAEQAKEAAQAADSAANPVANTESPAPGAADAAPAGATGTAAELPSAVAADPSVPVPPSAQTDPASSGTAADLPEAAAADPSLPADTKEPTSVTSSATESKAECGPTLGAEIVTLREPQWGAASNVWDLLYSDEKAAESGMEVFSDLLQLDPTTVVAAGAYTKDKNDEIYHPLIVKIDERLRPVWDVREETSEQRTIHRILKSKDGFTVAGDISDKARGNGIYIASYTDDGKVKGKPMPVYESGGDLDAKAIIPAQDGGGYIVAAQFIDSRDQEKQHGILYKISNGGNIVWKRSFLPGQSTVFNNVQATLDGSYVVSGQIVIDGTKGGGWLLRVDQDGAIKWQRTYPRGMSASLQAAAQTKEGDFIVTGKIRPFDHVGKGLSAWVMKTDPSGTPVWQRFFRGSYDYEAPDLIVYEDGRASVLINAGGMDSDRRSHARLITFSPQGQMHHVEDFTDGQNASASRLIAGAGGERIIVGYAQTSFGEDQATNEADAAPSYTYDGWILAGVPLDTFEDPCATSPMMSPILP